MVGSLTEILDRLTGVGEARAKAEEAAKSVEKSLNWLLELDRRVTSLEAEARARRGRRSRDDDR